MTAVAAEIETATEDVNAVDAPMTVIAVGEREEEAEAEVRVVPADEDAAQRGRAETEIQVKMLEFAVDADDAAKDIEATALKGQRPLASARYRLLQKLQRPMTLPMPQSYHKGSPIANQCRQILLLPRSRRLLQLSCQIHLHPQLTPLPPNNSI